MALIDSRFLDFISNPLIEEVLYMHAVLFVHVADVADCKMWHWNVFNYMLLWQNLIAGVTTAAGALNLLAAASCWLPNCRGYIKKWNVSSLFELTIKLCFNRKQSFYCLFDNVAFENRLSFSGWRASTRLLNRDAGISQCWSPRELSATLFLLAWLCYQWG